MITTDAFTRGQNLIGAILVKMDRISKWEHKFMHRIFMLCLSMGGRFNFLQMGREGEYHEQTYRNNFSKSFDFLGFNLHLVNTQCSKDIIIGFDPSYISKSGKHTPGIGYYYSGCAGKNERGLEIGNLAAIDVNQNTAYHLEAIQSFNVSKIKAQQGYSIVDHYAGVIVQKSRQLETISHILVVDGYFAKYKFVREICERTNLTMICRLRDDANLNYLYSGIKSQGRGRPKKYDGKVDIKNVDKRRIRMVSSNDERIVYGAELYSVGLKRTIKVAFVEFLNHSGDIATTKIFFSTDLNMDSEDILKYYRARYQMEYLFRDSKQFTGLEHCQARSEEKLYFHFNTCLTAVSIGKAMLRNGAPNTESIALSISDVKTELRNRNMINRILSMYGFNHTLIKNNQIYRILLNFGKIAA